MFIRNGALIASAMRYKEVKLEIDPADQRRAWQVTGRLS
jgi:hypothetical protein